VTSDRSHRSRNWIVAGLVVVLAWVGFDLFGPRQTDIRVFDPREVARLDTVMWRSYYDRKPLPLFFQLAELLRDQFHLPWLRSHVVAASAARAAFVFKDGGSRADYEKALPDLVTYYSALRKVSLTPFDVEETARLELEWWIVHRERLGHGGERLERALAEAAAELYRAPVDRMQDYARARTAAMDIRDTKAVSGGVSEEDWTAIGKHLQTSWAALAAAVREGG
jgi:hypothetical protein